MIPISDVWTAMPVWGWVLLCVLAAAVGFAKTAINGIGTLCVAGMVMMFPARESTGLALLLFITGDLVATVIYRKNVDWKLLVNLIFPVLIGLGLGTAFLTFVDDLVLKRTIGIILLGLLIIGLLPRQLPANKLPVKMAYGSLAGFCTMVANAGGPPMNLYLLASKFEKWRFIGTTAWFFFIVNLTKVPFQIAQGIVTFSSLQLALTMVPAVLLGTWIGRVVIKKINQKLFDQLITILTAVSAVYLIIF